MCTTEQRNIRFSSKKQNNNKNKVKTHHSEFHVVDSQMGQYRHIQSNWEVTA